MTFHCTYFAIRKSNSRHWKTYFFLRDNFYRDFSDKEFETLKSRWTEVLSMRKSFKLNSKVFYCCSIIAKSTSQPYCGFRFFQVVELVKIFTFFWLLSSAWLKDLHTQMIFFLLLLLLNQWFLTFFFRGPLKVEISFMDP